MPGNDREKNPARNQGGKSGKKTWRKNMAEKHIFFKNNGITMEY